MSAAAERLASPAWAATATPAPATTGAPSVTVPLRFVLTGVLALFATLGLLVARPDILATYHYNQYAVAATHLLVLGFLTSVLMGAMYQLVPVALETRLHSEKLARWQFGLHVVGVAGMVWMFWRWDLKQVGHFGSVFATGVALFLYNLGRTLATVPRWNVVATGITSALAWLAATVLVGLAVAAAKCTYESAATMTAANPLRPALLALEATAAWVNRFDALAVMHGHAHLGGLGFFVMMIVGVSFKLVPMFTLGELQSPRRAGAALLLLNLGLALLFPAFALRSPWKSAAALLVTAGLGVYAVELRAILRRRQRRVLDWGLRHFLAAMGVLALVTGLGLLLGWPGLPATQFTTQLETVYGFLGLVGVAGFTVLGFLYKIIPFQVWFHCYRREVGRHRVPALAELYSERLQIAGFWLYVAGLGITSAGAALGSAPVARAGVLCLLASLLAFGSNLGLMLRHFVRPQLAPLKPAGPATPPAPRAPATPD
jgi:cbb3-type cytochrome oxidase subunit 1